MAPGPHHMAHLRDQYPALRQPGGSVPMENDPRSLGANLANDGSRLGAREPIGTRLAVPRDL